MSFEQPHEKPRLKCPICSAPAVQNYRPFCSKRCADVDLNRWLSGTYAIAGDEDSEEDGSVQEVTITDNKKNEENW